jgi:VWFA-related protein
VALKRTAVAIAMLFVVACASTLPAFAQEENALTINIASVDDSDSANLSAVVDVLDAQGNPVNGLTVDNFQASLDDQPATISGLQSVVDTRSNLAVVLVVDVSGSMAGDPLAAAQSAAALFIQDLGPNDTVAILSFNDSVTVAQDVTTDKAAAADALQRLVASGNTALFEATSRGVDKASESTSDRRTIILLSDGVDYGGMSTVSRDDSIARARAAGIPVYTIALGSDVDKAYLTELAQATGARFLETPSPEGLSQLYSEVGTVLRGQYVVTLGSSNVAAGDQHTLTLSVSLNGQTASTSRVLAVEQAPQPEVTLTGFQPGGELAQASTVTAVVNGVTPTEVRFLIDGALVAALTAPPYQTTIDPSQLGQGGHSLRVEVIGPNGLLVPSDQAFIVPVPPETINKQKAGVALLIVFACVASIYVILHRSRRRRGPAGRTDVQIRLRPWYNNNSNGSLSEPVEEPLAPPPPEPEEAAGKLVIVAGPNLGQEFAVGESPLSVGSAGWCDISFAGHDDTVGPEEARAWVHQGRLVFHKLARLSLLANDEAIGGWLILESGDEIEIGPFRLRFISLTPSVSSRPSTESASRRTTGATLTELFSQVPSSEGSVELPEASSGGPISIEDFRARELKPHDRDWSAEDSPQALAVGAPAPVRPVWPVEPVDQPPEEPENGLESNVHPLLEAVNQNAGPSAQAQAGFEQVPHTWPDGRPDGVLEPSTAQPEAEQPSGSSPVQLEGTETPESDASSAVVPGKDSLLMFPSIPEPEAEPPVWTASPVAARDEPSGFEEKDARRLWPWETGGEAQVSAESPPPSGLTAEQTGAEPVALIDQPHTPIALPDVDASLAEKKESPVEEQASKDSPWPPAGPPVEPVGLEAEQSAPSPPAWSEVEPPYLEADLQPPDLLPGQPLAGPADGEFGQETSDRLPWASTDQIAMSVGESEVEELTVQPPESQPSESSDALVSSQPQTLQRTPWPWEQSADSPDSAGQPEASEAASPSPLQRPPWPWEQPAGPIEELPSAPQDASPATSQRPPWPWEKSSTPVEQPPESGSPQPPLAPVEDQAGQESGQTAESQATEDPLPPIQFPPSRRVEPGPPELAEPHRSLRVDYDPLNDQEEQEPPDQPDRSNSSRYHSPRPLLWSIDPESTEQSSGTHAGADDETRRSSDAASA